MQDLNTGDWEQAIDDWGMSVDLIQQYAGGINVYNVRDYNANYNTGQLPSWLNSAATKKLINVPSK